MKTILGTLLFVSIIYLMFILPFTDTSIGNYSEGERTGIFNKVSKKGVFCKTYEGYILVGNGQNIQPEQFSFTIKNEELAKQVENLTGQIVTVKYTQPIFSTPCWGDTKTNVIGIELN